MSEASIDITKYNPSTWPGYTGRSLRVAWIDESPTPLEELPIKLAVISHLPNVSLATMHWNESTDNPSELAHFFDQIEAVIILREFNKDKSILSYAAAMGRAVLTDDRSQTLINHGESGLVVHSEPQIIAEGLLLLRDGPQLRGTFGKNLRQKYLTKCQGMTKPCAE